MSCRAMGRRSLEATKLLCSLIVRAAVDFFRAWPFFAGAFLLPDELEGEAFVWVGWELPLFFAGWLVDVEVSCAGNPAPCSNSSTLRRAEVNRVGHIVTPSLTRVCADSALGHCLLRCLQDQSMRALPAYFTVQIVADQFVRHTTGQERRGACPAVFPLLFVLFSRARDLF